MIRVGSGTPPMFLRSFHAHVKVPPMAKKAITTENDAAEVEKALRVYEAGYHITPQTKEEDVEKVVGGIRAVIEKAGGTFISEGTPTLMKLSFPMFAREGDKNIEYDRGYFGWLKFEAAAETAETVTEHLRTTLSVFRSMVFRTVREDTRAKIKAPALREVKRGDTIKAAPRKAEESAAPVSEEQLEKALEDITTE